MCVETSPAGTATLIFLPNCSTNSDAAVCVCRCKFVHIVKWDVIQWNYDCIKIKLFVKRANTSKYDWSTNVWTWAKLKAWYYGLLFILRNLTTNSALQCQWLWHLSKTHTLHAHKMTITGKFNYIKLFLSVLFSLQLTMCIVRIYYTFYWHMWVCFGLVV